MSKFQTTNYKKIKLLFTRHSSIVNRQSSIINYEAGFTPLKNFTNKNSCKLMNKRFNDIKLPSILNSLTGFTMTELVVVMALMSILVAMAYSQFRTPREKIACKAIFSAMHLAKMRAVATGYDAYVDFDTSTGQFFTVYLDTDDDKAFGEISNGNSQNEFTESHFSMYDSSEELLPNAFGITNIPGVDISFGDVVLGLSVNNFPTNDPEGNTVSTLIQADGVDFNGADRVQFNSKGMAVDAGSVYINNPNDTSNTTDDRGCMVDILATGIIRMSNWDGSSWSNTW